jgi:hypothetical protein
MKTSLEIRDDLWTRAKFLAIRKKTSMRRVFEDALDSYLPKTVVLTAREVTGSLGRPGLGGVPKIELATRRKGRRHTKLNRHPFLRGGT